MMEYKLESLFLSDIGFIRESVVYRDFAFRIDKGKSKFAAHVESGRCWWMIEIHTIYQDNKFPTDEDDDNRCPPIDEPTAELCFPHENLPMRWRELSNSTCIFNFNDSNAFPVVPGSLSAAYVGYHYSCIDHHLSFGNIFHNVLPFRWKTLGKQYPEDPGELFYVDVELQFFGVRCRTSLESDAEILASISQWFEPSEFQIGARDGSTVWLKLTTERQRL